MFNVLRCIVQSLFLSALCLPATHAEPLEKYGLSIATIKTWLGQSKDRGWAYQVHTTSIIDGKTKPQEVAQFDPGLAEGQRWRLLSIDGREPTEKELQSFNDKKNNSKKSKIDLPSDITDCSVLSAKGNVLTLQLHFDKSKLDKQQAFLDHLTALVEVDTKQQRLLSFELRSTQPFSQGLATVKELRVRNEYGVHAESGRAILLRTVVHTKASALLMSFDVVERQERTKYKLVGAES